MMVASDISVRAKMGKKDTPSENRVPVRISFKEPSIAILLENFSRMKYRFTKTMIHRPPMKCSWLRLKYANGVILEKITTQMERNTNPVGFDESMPFRSRFF